MVSNSPFTVSVSEKSSLVKWPSSYPYRRKTRKKVGHKTQKKERFVAWTVFADRLNNIHRLVIPSIARIWQNAWMVNKLNCLPFEQHFSCKTKEYHFWSQMLISYCYSGRNLKYSGTIMYLIFYISHFLFFLLIKCSRI